MRVGIVAILKDEARYLLEWVAFHRAIGIRNFFIADNGGSDGTSALLKRLDRAGHIMRFDFSALQGVQLASYNQMIPRLRGHVDLAVIIDGDEFIRPLGSEPVDAVFARAFADPNVSALGMNWATYGSSGRVERGRGLVTACFTQRAEQSFRVNQHVKTVFRVDRFVSAVNSHFVEISDGRYVDVEGNDIRWHPEFGVGVATQTLWRGARVDHFAIKSLEEFHTVKRPRGRANLPKDDPEFFRGDAYLAEHDRNEVYDPMPSRLVWNTRLQILRMRWRLFMRERLAKPRGPALSGG